MAEARANDGFHVSDGSAAPRAHRALASGSTGGGGGVAAWASQWPNAARSPLKRFRSNRADPTPWPLPSPSEVYCHSVQVVHGLGTTGVAAVVQAAIHRSNSAPQAGLSRLVLQ